MRNGVVQSTVAFFLVNRVELQKRTQATPPEQFGFVFGVQLGLRQTQALIDIKQIIIKICDIVRFLRKFCRQHPVNRTFLKLNSKDFSQTRNDA